MIEFAIEADVAEITLNAPHKLNALDEEGIRQLGAAYDAAEEAGVRALLLRGSGRAFVPGATFPGSIR